MLVCVVRHREIGHNHARESRQSHVENLVHLGHQLAKVLRRDGKTLKACRRRNSLDVPGRMDVFDVGVGVWVGGYGNGRMRDVFVGGRRVLCVGERSWEVCEGRAGFCARALECRTLLLGDDGPGRRLIRFGHVWSLLR